VGSETINANDSRMNQVVDLDGVLFGGDNTTVTSASGRPGSASPTSRSVQRARLLPQRYLRAVRPGPGGRPDLHHRAGRPAGRRVHRLRRRGIPDSRRGPLGDYSAAVFADGAIWMGNELIPNAPRTLLANWGTFLSRLPA
jgi:hypothetical protein